MKSLQRIVADPGNRVLAVLVAVMVVSLFWLVDPYFETIWDAVLYVLTTRSILAGDGYRVFGEPFHLRPPGFSLLLVPVYALFGEDFLVLNVVTSLFGILALALLFVWFRARLGIAVSAAICLSLWFNPQYQSVCNQTMSDTVGLASLMACLLIDRRTRHRRGFVGDAGLGLLIGLTGYLRTVCFLAVPAILVSRVLRAPEVLREQGGALRAAARLALLAALPVLLQVPWSMWKDAHPAPRQSQQHGIYSYWVAQWHLDPTDPTSRRLWANELWERVPVRTEQCVTSLGSRMPKATLQGFLQPDEIQAIRDANRRAFGWPLGWLAVACLLAVGLWRRDSGSVFALGNLCVLLVYFDFDDRVIIPVYVFAVGAVMELLHRGLVRWMSAARARAAAAALLVAMGVSDAFPANDRTWVKERHETLAEVGRWVEETYPQPVPVAGMLGHRAAVFLQRPVWFMEVITARQGEGGARAMLRNRHIWVVVHTGPDMGVMGRVMEPFFQEFGTEVFRVGEVRVIEVDPPWRKGRLRE